MTPLDQTTRPEPGDGVAATAPTLVRVPDAAEWDALVQVAATVPPHVDEAFVGMAGSASRLLPAVVHDSLVEFADHGHRSGAMIVRGAPVGDVPDTPPSPTAPTTKGSVSELTLLTVARRLGQPVGYAPEHGGQVVQNIVPIAAEADRQVSTSSRVELMFHTETAFHPHRPRYLLLLCLRGDPSAGTTLVSAHDLIERLDPGVVATMFEPRFRTAVDASFLAGRTNRLGPPRPLLEGTVEQPTFVFDADLMRGTDPEADDVVRHVSRAIDECHATVVLEAGDLLVVDNHVAVHGRTPFAPRFDGTDRWLQRTFVVADLAPSAADRDGRVITTEFGDAPPTDV